MWETSSTKRWSRNVEPCRTRSNEVDDLRSIHDERSDYDTALYHPGDRLPSPLYKSIDPPPSQHADKDPYDSDPEELGVVIHARPEPPPTTS